MRAIKHVDITTQLIFIHTNPLTYPYKDAHIDIKKQSHVHTKNSLLTPLPLSNPCNSESVLLFCNGCSYCLNGGVQQWRKKQQLCIDRGCFVLPHQVK